jgi:hypothetical protein
MEIPPPQCPSFPFIPLIPKQALKDHLFGVDVSARKVVECDRYKLVAPPRDYPIANRFIRSWVLPQSVSSGTYQSYASSHLWLFCFRTIMGCS